MLLGNSMSKALALMLITAFAVSSFVMAGSVFAQSTSKPSVPEFTVKYVDNSYYVPPTTTTDPYTGETVTQGGFYGKGKPEIEITIKNQPFTGLHYQVRTKGHFSQDWSIVEYWIKEAYNPPDPYPEQDYTAEYTILKFGSLVSQNIPSRGQIDIQVQALIGHDTIRGDPAHSALYNMYYPIYDFSGESSGWSDTQTLTIGHGLQQLILLGAAIATVVIGACLVLVYFIKRKQPKVRTLV